MVIFQFVVISVLFLLIFKFDNIILKLMLFVFWIPLLPLFLNSLGFSLVGVFGITEFDNATQQYAVNLCILSTVIFFGVLWPIRNVTFEGIRIRINVYLRFFFLLLLFIALIPVLNTHNENGFKSSTFYIVINTVLILSTKGKDVVWFCQLVVLLLAIASGERVDSIMFLLCLFIFDKSLRLNITSIRYLYFSLPFVFFILVAIGFIRNGVTPSYVDLFSSIYSQQTISDVSYVFETGVEYYLDKGINPNVLINLFGGFLPDPIGGVSSIYNYRNILDNYMPNAGGGLFYTEGLLAIGSLGVCVYSAAFACVCKKLYLSKKGWAVSLFLLIFCMYFRIVWYGLVYAYKPILLLLFIRIFLQFKRITIIEKSYD